MSATRDLREKMMLVTAVGKAVSETAKAIKAEASAAAAQPATPGEVASNGRDSDRT